MRKILKKIHLYLSLPIGLLISLICFTGAIMVFDSEIDELFHSERFHVKGDYQSQQKLPIDSLVTEINSQLDTNTVKSITVYSSENRTSIVDLKKGRISAYVNPYTGKIIYQEAYNDSFYFKVLSLHRWLLGKPSGTGRDIIRISTIVLLVLSISGLILWIPRNRNRLKNSFKITLKKSFTRFNYDLHVVGGMYVFIFMLLLSITGLAISYPSVKKSLEKVFVNAKTEEVKENTKEEAKEKTEILSSEAKTINPMQVSLGLLKTQYPSFEYITLEPSKALVHLREAPNERANELVLLNKSNGQINKITAYGETNPVVRFNGWLYSLHVGSYWGVFSKILTFLASIIGGLLPITGYYMYFKKLIGKRKL